MNFKEFKKITSKTHSFCLACGRGTIKAIEKSGRELYYCSSCQKTFERAMVIRPTDIYDFNPSGAMRHFSIGALIERDRKYLLFKRRKFPFVWVSPAGHLNKGEDAKEATVREVEEETGLKVKTIKLLFEEELSNDPCRRGADVHYWRFYQCKCVGKLKPSNEAEPETIDWYGQREISRFELSSPTKYFFRKMGIIKNV
jgi:ADP-ribose pyrophosphatase YjhB (NUDIX family)